MGKNGEAFIYILVISPFKQDNAASETESDFKMA